jgi:hypothetical protein
MLELVRFSSEVDTTVHVPIDICPGAMLANTLGTDDGKGHPVNPVTGAPYTSDVVERSDFLRVVAEFWADGPRSETPPGHWNVLANAVADALPAKRIGGAGPRVNDLEWDVKVYLALNGAVHDAAVWAWGNKTVYDSSRPITLIRYLAAQHALPLEPGLVEVITADTTKTGERHAALAGHEGEIAIRSWKGSPDDPKQDVAGVVWKLGIEWLPYQPVTFVTPPFPGYTSGHSVFSRAGAEVLAAITGSPFFPGGLGTYSFAKGRLNAEKGPSADLTLQWATYFDASDQAAISRRFGGIHPFYDDYPSRIAGSRIGQKAYANALTYYGEPAEAPCPPRRCGELGPTPRD